MTYATTHKPYTLSPMVKTSNLVNLWLTTEDANYKSTECNLKFWPVFLLHS